MTDTTTLAPTDAELHDLADRCTPNTETGSLNYRDFARAVLAKWGAPAPASGEPVAKVVSWTNGSYSRNYKLEWLRQVEEGALLYTAPPAQEVRTPLDERDILHRAAGHSHPGMAGYDIELARFVESAHGITAAQKEKP